MRNSLFAVAATALAWASSAHADPPALTIYNQNFAVVRQSVPLNLQQGVNTIDVTDTTAHLEPDSVMLRDPSGMRSLQVLEQNYRSDPISQALMLSLFEGKTIDFNVADGEGKSHTVTGKIVRSSYVPHSGDAMEQYGSQYYQAQMASSQGTQDIVEVDGKLRFGLPGIPVFPALPDDTVLKPTLHWVVQTDRAGPLDAELAYVTGGMNWHADYNITAPETGDVLDLVGWVTMDNQSGKSFENAKIKLMAGDVSKIQQDGANGVFFARSASIAMDESNTPPVTEKAFDDYHLYTLQRPTTLLDRETKQVEFVRGANIKSQRIYVYDGAQIDRNRYNGWNYENIRNQRDYGTQSNPKVWVMREFKNTEANGLGMPLPKGRVRFYRRDTGGQLEFTGENLIDHTPKDETISIFTGDAFDIVGERTQTDYKMDPQQNRWLDESFKIQLRNHKDEPVEVRVIEHLYRWTNWDITQKSDVMLKTDAHTIEFRVQVPANGEKDITYTAHYSW